MIGRVYRYGDSIKIIWFKHGICSDSLRFNYDTENNSYDEKLSNNIARARGRVLEIALCNPWEWFVTLTLDGEKQDRSDLNRYIKDLGNWIGNFNRKYGCNMKYILVPELHKDGKSWHMHGLLHDVPDAALVRNEHGYWDIPYYRNRFGYISLSAVKSHEKVSRYITKYISKSMSARVEDKAKHLFYASKKLNGRELLVEGCMPILDGAYDGDYTLSKWVSNPAEIATTMGIITELTF